MQGTSNLVTRRHENINFYCQSQSQCRFYLITVTLFIGISCRLFVEESQIKLLYCRLLCDPQWSRNLNHTGSLLKYSISVKVGLVDYYTRDKWYTMMALHLSTNHQNLITMLVMLVVVVVVHFYTTRPPQYTASYCNNYWYVDMSYLYIEHP